MFKFKVDENMPAEAAAVLAQAGHDALSVRDQHMSDRPDAGVATVCRQENRALVTLDLDFSDIRLPAGRLCRHHRAEAVAIG